MPSKPIPDKVSIGLSSILGSLGVLGAAALAVISFVNGDQSSDTIAAMAAGAAVLVGLMHSRSIQQVALTHTAVPRESAARDVARRSAAVNFPTPPPATPVGRDMTPHIIASPPKPPRVRKPKVPPAP